MMSDEETKTRLTDVTRSIAELRATRPPHAVLIGTQRAGLGRRDLEISERLPPPQRWADIRDVMWSDIACLLAGGQEAVAIDLTRFALRADLMGGEPCKALLVRLNPVLKAKGIVGGGRRHGPDLAPADPPTGCPCASCTAGNPNACSLGHRPPPTLTTAPVLPMLPHTAPLGAILECVIIPKALIAELMIAARLTAEHHDAAKQPAEYIEARLLRAVEAIEGLGR